MYSNNSWYNDNCMWLTFSGYSWNIHVYFYYLLYVEYLLTSICDLVGYYIKCLKTFSSNKKPALQCKIGSYPSKIVNHSLITELNVKNIVQIRVFVFYKHNVYFTFSDANCEYLEKNTDNINNIAFLKE